MLKMQSCGFVSLFTVAFLAPHLRADEDAAFKNLAPLTAAERVFTGKITKVIPGPVGLSDPPVYTFTLEFAVTDTLRGSKPAAEGFSYQIRAKVKPAFDGEAMYLVGLNKKQIVTLLLADKDDLARAKKLMALPGGWSIVGGKPLSPWVSLGDKAWPKEGLKLSEVVCSTTGRPALLCGEGIELKVEQVPAKNPMKFQNDMFGDGTFKVSVTNTTKADVTVNALLTNGKGTILWADSILLLYKGKPSTFAGVGLVTKDSKPLLLKAGESVSTELDTLPIEGVDWPRGGSRVYFDFVLGEKSVNNFFYYFSRLHDPMRAEALKKSKGEK